MLDAAHPPHPSHHLSLKDWVSQVLGLPEIHLRFRLRGNDLHILCEGDVCPPAAIVVSRLVAALKHRQGLTGFSIQGGPIYQIILYGRRLDQTQPDWTHAIWLSQLTESSATESAEETQEASLERIAQTLSQTLSQWGVSVKVARRDLPPTPADSLPQKRLWVLCECNYSLEESLLAEPIAECLRTLPLSQFQEAIVCSQVTGESQPDWRLRVNLTPQEQMLREWARWGDVQAIARLLEQALASAETVVKAVLKDSTLHLFCRHRFSPEAEEQRVPSQAIIRKILAPLLTELAPQGLQGATLYGIKSQEDETQTDAEETPVWIDWLDLPASQQPKLVSSPLTLAQQGNLRALQFLLERLVNPDLDRRLATGGIELQLRRKQDLLHILSEAIAPPAKSQVTTPLARFLKTADISGISGIRIYGRRAGKSDPAWTYGLDFTPRKRLVPEASPEFSATDHYVEDLLTPPEDEAIDSDDLSPPLTLMQARWGQFLRLRLQQILCASQLVVPTLEITALAPLRDRDTTVNLASYSQGAMVTAVWSMLGLLLVAGTDGLLSRLNFVEAKTSPVVALSPVPAPPVQDSPPQISLQKSQGAQAEVFNASGFTRQGDFTLTIEEIEAKTADRPRATKAAILAAAQSNNPSFNNRLLDEKLALYQQQLQKNPPPDVLIVGSSRALRGIDPQALEEALAIQGYNNVQVFNFGINGATAQTVDLQIRRLLNPQQLPKLIIWADGARAFNSGRMDETYNAMRKSPAYQALIAGTFPNLQGAATPSPDNSEGAESPNSLANGYEGLNQWLNERLSRLSRSYQQRDRLKSNLQSYVSVFTSAFKSEPESGLADDPDLEATDQALDLDGFLPLTVRYNPASYYQKYAKVTGEYDRDYESFRMEGEQSKALLSLMQFANSHQIKVVFVNLPLTQDYLDPTRLRYEAQFQQFMQRFSAQTGLIFRDLSQAWPTQYDYFSDPSHLNRYGAYEVSQAIAKDPMIPWPIKE